MFFGGGNQTWPGVALCAVLGGRLGKRHQQSPRLALLEACDLVVSESGSSGQPKVRGDQCVSTQKEAVERNRR